MIERAGNTDPWTRQMCDNHASVISFSGDRVDEVDVEEGQHNQEDVARLIGIYWLMTDWLTNCIPPFGYISTVDKVGLAPTETGAAGKHADVGGESGCHRECSWIQNDWWRKWGFFDVIVELHEFD